jgi:hypothetical protein
MPVGTCSFGFSGALAVSAAGAGFVSTTVLDVAAGLLPVSLLHRLGRIGSVATIVVELFGGAAGVGVIRSFPTGSGDGVVCDAKLGGVSGFAWLGFALSGRTLLTTGVRGMGVGAGVETGGSVTGSGACTGTGGVVTCTTALLVTGGATGGIGAGAGIGGIVSTTVLLGMGGLTGAGDSITGTGAVTGNGGTSLATVGLDSGGVTGSECIVSWTGAQWLSGAASTTLVLIGVMTGVACTYVEPGLAVMVPCIIVEGDMPDGIIRA